MSNETNAELLQAREDEYKAREAEADAFVKGAVARQQAARAFQDPFKFKHQGIEILNPFALPSHQSWDRKPGVASIDPWECYGSSFCTSGYVTEALAFLRTNPPKESTKKKDSHPLYQHKPYCP